MSKPGRVLLGANEPDARVELANAFSTEDCELKVARDGLETVVLAREWQPQIVVLRLTAPRRGGVDVCRRVRRFSDAPILVLDPLADETDRVAGLAVGADAYLAEPISQAELRARVRAHLRPPRASPLAVPIPPTDLVRAGRLTVSPSQRRAWINEAVVSFTRREFDVLVHLARHRNVVLTRGQIVDAVWGPDAPPDSRRIDTVISRLRSKLDQQDAGYPQLHTVPGVGYALRHGIQGAR